jgi:carboxypeptidase family protein
MRSVAPGVVVLLLCLPTLAAAQASITGVVRDESGAVLPGVSVEAESAALLERVRTAVTDGTGQFRIEALSPGTYTVTFSLPGFSSFRREGIELNGTFIATVSASMAVGVLEQTVTVSGEAPISTCRGRRGRASSSTSYNVLNNNTPTSLNNTFGGGTPWQAPQAIPLARFAKVSAQLDF